MPSKRKLGQHTPAARQRKRSKRKYILYYILTFVILLAAGIILSLTVFFKIESINIEGKTRYEAKELIKAFGVNEGDNLIRISKSIMIRKMGSNFPYIKDINLRRVFPSQLIIQVLEEVPIASLEQEGRTVIVTEKGKILEISSCENFFGFPRICGISTDTLKEGDKLQTGSLEKLDVVISLQKLLNSHNFTVDVIDVSDISAIRMLYDGRVDVFLGGTFEHDYKINFTKTAIDKSINKDFVGILDVSKRPTAILRPLYIFNDENWHYPKYLLEDYKKVLTVKPNVFNLAVENSENDKDNQN